MAILSAILEITGCWKPNFSLIQNINEKDACMQFEQNPLKKKKVNICKIISSNGGIFSAILETVTQRKPNFQILQDNDESDACMKLGPNHLKKKTIIAYPGNKQTDGQTEHILQSFHQLLFVGP